MAFATKYKTQFQDWEADTVTIEIQEDGFAGTLEEFTSPDGAIITHQTSVYDKHAYIIPSKAKFSLHTNNEWDLNELLYSSSRQYKIIITNGSSKELFRGWMLPAINSEDYTTGRYKINITATDGLADLKDIPYLDSNGELYDTFQYPLTIAQNCLDQTGLSLDLWENNSIYASAGMTAPSNTISALNQCYIHTKAYGARAGDVMTCWDVLSAIAQAFYCRIFQDKDIDTDTEVRWYWSMIDKIDETATYRHFLNAGTYDTFKSNVPLLTMGTDINHVGGKGKISVHQTYKRVNVTRKYGVDYNVLEGLNFEDQDFASSSSLNNWGTLDKCQLVSSWGTATIAQATVNGNEVAGLAYNSDATITGLKAARDPGSGTYDGQLRITHSNGYGTSDWIMVTDGIYKGMYKYQFVSTDFIFTLEPYIEDAEVPIQYITNMDGIETTGLTPLGNDINLVDGDNQSMTIDASWHYDSDASISGRAVVIIVLAYINATDYKTLGSDGVWHDYDADIIKPIIEPLTADALTLQEFSLTVSMNDANFYTAGSPDLYVGIMNVQGSKAKDDIQYNHVKVTVNGTGESILTNDIDLNNTIDLDIDFFHPGGDEGVNDEYRHVAPVYDDATPKRFIYNWSGVTVPNEDLTYNTWYEMWFNLYSNNSQIWNGSLRGDMTIINAVTDPLNFDRQFQIQKITRNLLNNYNSIQMVETTPQGDLRNASISRNASFREWTKEANSVETKTVTFTNNGNVDLICAATITTGDDTYFNITSDTSFNLAVGASKDVDMDVDAASSGVYQSQLRVADIRPAYESDSAITVDLAHIAVDATRRIQRSTPTDATIAGILGSGTVNLNDLAGGNPPTSTKTITGLYQFSTDWDVNVTGISPSATGTMQILGSGSLTVFATKTQGVSSTFNQSINSLIKEAADGGWDGSEDLDADFV